MARRRLLLASLLVLGFGLGWLGLTSCSGSSPERPDTGTRGCPDAARDAVIALDARGGSDRAAPDDSGPGPAPWLTELRVEAAKGPAQVTLTPGFSPDVHDYYVRCSAGPNALRVSIAASRGAEAGISQPATSPFGPQQTLEVQVNEGQAIVVVAQDGKARSEYWVRCLPHDMPPMAWNPHPGATGPTHGYYLLGNLFPPKGGAGYALVLDGNGVPVWYAKAPPAYGAGNVDSLFPGIVSFIPFSPTATQPFELRQLNPPTTTPIAPDGYAINLHELRALAGGNYLAIANPLKFGVDLTGLSIALLNGAIQELGPNSTIQDCAIVEFTGSGKVVWKWLASDHIEANKESTYPTIAFGGASAPDGGTLVDVFHCNSIDVDPTNGNLLVSARDADALFYVDKASGRVRWKMGGSPYSKDNAGYVEVTDRYYRQHDARFGLGWSTCSDGAGQITVFDDETGAIGPARAAVYDVVTPSGAAGSGGGSATLSWEYKGRQSSVLAGSFRITSDGSRVVGWGRGGAPNLTFTEVDALGNDLLDFGFTDDDSSYRVIKVPLEQFDLEVLRRSAGTM